MPEIFGEHTVWVMPILIFLSRIADVSIGTLRIIFLSRGLKLLAPLCGFFEVFIWLLAIGQIMQNLDSWPNSIAYALGFTAGNYVGMVIEDRLAMGLLSVWIITPRDAPAMLEDLKQHHYGLTRVAARGLQGKVRIVIMIIRRRTLRNALHIVRNHNPEAFVTVKDVRAASGGYFAGIDAHSPLDRWRFWRTRKGR